MSFTDERRALLNEHYKSGDIEPWALFILLVNKFRYLEFYRGTRTDPFDIDAHIKWGKVVIGFNAALREAKVTALLQEQARMVGQSAAVAGDADDVEELRAEARAEVPATIVDLLRMAEYTQNPKGSVQLWPTTQKITTEYERLMRLAVQQTESWFERKANGDEEPAEPAPFEDDDKDAAPCPRDDPPYGGMAKGECRGETDDFADLAQQLLGASIDEMFAAMVALQDARDCGAVARFIMSEYGKQQLGIDKEQELWKRLCERNGWSNPPVLAEEVVEPPRRVYVDGARPRFMLAIRKSPSGAQPVTEVRRIEPEYKFVPALTRTLFDWHALYMQRCDKV